MRPADRARLLRLARMAVQRGTPDARDTLCGYVDGLIADAVDEAVRTVSGAAHILATRPLIAATPTWGERLREFWRRLHT